MEEVIRIALEPGSHQTKIGITGDDAPRSVERPFYLEETDPITGKKTLVPQPNRDLNPNIKSYFDQAYLCDWDSAEQIWSHDIDTLVGNGQYGLLMTAKPHASLSYLTKCCEFAFESNPNLNNFGLSDDNTLALYSSGRTTGLVIDFGHFQTRITGTFEGLMIPSTVHIWNVGSVHCSALVKRLAMLQPGFARMPSSKDRIAEDIKKMIANRSTVGNYELPDESILEFGTELQDLFQYQIYGAQPSNETSWTKSVRAHKFEDFEGSRVDLSQLILQDGDEYQNLATLVNSALQEEVDHQIRKDLAGNIVLAGGGSMPVEDKTAMEQSFSQEYYKHAKTEAVMRFKVIAPPERNYSTWIGASILGSLTTYEGLIFQRATYDEAGALHMLHNRTAHGF